MSTGNHPTIDMPASATPDWATVPPPETGNDFLTLVLLLIQFIGLIAILKGVKKVIVYYKPNATNAPASLGGPVLMILAGLFAIVPDRVYQLGIDTLQQFGWL